MSELIRLLSENTDASNALAAVASAVAAFLSAVVAGFSLWVARSTLKHQRKHNVMSLRPVAEVTVGDWEETLRVTLRNNGAGPLAVLGLSREMALKSDPAFLTGCRIFRTRFTGRTSRETSMAVVCPPIEPLCFWNSKATLRTTPSRYSAMRCGRLFVPSR